MGSTPVVRMLTHPSAPVTSVSVSQCGKYMVTTGKDCKMKVWDIRNTYKNVHTYFTAAPATSSSFSDTGLVAIGVGNEVQVWKNTDKEK
jgi:U3 small nucleolar RNA-associated protein 7